MVLAFWKLRTCLCVCQALNRDEMMAIDRDSEEEDEEEDEESEVHTTRQSIEWDHVMRVRGLGF